MGNDKSSAIAQELIRYANAAADINGALNNEATKLGAALETFVATCTEYNTGVGPGLAGELREYVRRTTPKDEWVRQVGKDFAKADQRSIPPWVVAPFAGAGMFPFAQSGGTGARPEVKPVQTVRGSPKPGPGETLVGSSRKQMRAAALRRIDSTHPLKFLLDPKSFAPGAKPKDRKFKPHRGFRPGEILIGRTDLVEMSHIRSLKGVKEFGGRERLMLEIAYENQLKNWSIEAPPHMRGGGIVGMGGEVLDDKAISIKGIAVSRRSARIWESEGRLKAGTVDAAPVVELDPAPASDAAKSPARSSATGSVRGSTLLRGASRGLFVAGAAVDAYNIATADNKVKESVKVAGGWAGAWAGAKGGAIAGAAIGSIFPGPGTAIGTVVGGVVGGALGYMAGSKLGEELFDLF
jgi:hypothetical protein